MRPSETRSISLTSSYLRVISSNAYYTTTKTLKCPGARGIAMRPLIEMEASGPAPLRRRMPLAKCSGGSRPHRSCKASSRSRVSGYSRHRSRRGVSKPLKPCSLFRQSGDRPPGVEDTSRIRRDFRCLSRRFSIGYSCRSATSGFTRVARLAGM